MGQGIGILVSKFPKETAASYSLRDPDEVSIYDSTAIEIRSTCIVAPKLMLCHFRR
jgi:hypothetical protein